VGATDVGGTDDGVGGGLQAAFRAELAAAFEELRRFVDRRISELSAEIHGATQLMDFSEANLSGQLARIHDEVARVVAMPVAATRNSGLELEVVVETTEAAANQIMEAAEAIGNLLQEGKRDDASVQAVTERLNAIFEACTFQDLTGQRIRRAIEHLQKVESMLGGILPGEGRAPPALASDMTAGEVAGTGGDLSQHDIDQVLHAAQSVGGEAPAGGAAMAQDEIDRLLG